jgi:hypothetical protein
VVIDSLQSSLSSWTNPAASSSGVDSIDWRASSLAAPPVIGLGPGCAALSYRWNQAASLKHISLGMAAATPSFQRSVSRLSAYVNGDGGKSRVRFTAMADTAGGATPALDASPWTTVDWIGWRLVPWSMGDISTTGLNPATTGNWIFSGIEILPDSVGATTNGRLLFSQLQVTAKAVTSVQPSYGKPLTAYLEQNYPNPANPTTRISYTIGRVVAPSASEGRASTVSAAGSGLQVAGSGKTAGSGWQVAGSDVRLTIYDVLGREVAVLVDGVQSPGRHELVFDASGLASGVYLYRLTAGSFVSTKRMVILK